jgi:outer membrane protein assembly factor BamD (BamD/ComL family)
MLEEATIVTRDHDKLPTIEIPFPEASGSMESPRPVMHANPHSTMAAAAGGGAAAVAMPQARSIPLGRARPAELVRKTLDGVRALPLWRSYIPPAIFFSIVGLCVLALVIVVASIRSKRPAILKVDTTAEAKVLRERLLRTQGNQLLRQGRVIEAFQKFEQLSKLAPSSPYVSGLMSKLAALRQVEESNKQQLVTAKQRFDEGMVFFNNKQYPEAIRAFEESFHLNPNSDDTANYLKLAQQEEDRVRQEEARAASARGTQPVATAGRPVTTSRGPQPRGVAGHPVGPAQITTYINAPVTDGYIMVKIGGEVVAHENLWQETGRFLLRRRVPRQVNVTKEITPKNADVDVWVIIPALNIQEHRTLKQNFLPGIAHRLTVTFDPQNKTFNYQMN